MNKRWYLLVCYVGLIEVFSEDGTKKYFEGNSSDYNKHPDKLMNAVYLSSCVAQVKN